MSICKDITTLNKEDIYSLIDGKTIDIILGGPPCQGMSLSGTRQFQDPRNKLYLSYIKMVKKINPKAFVIENVPGLISLYKGQIKDHILYEFNKLGYTIVYKVLNTADFGVPQLRRRVIFVGLKNKTFEFPIPIKRPEKYVTCKMGIEDLPPLDGDFLGAENQEYKQAPNCEYQKLMRHNSKIIKNHIAALHSEKVKSIISLVPEGQNYKSLPEELRNSRNFNIAWTRFHGDKPAPTIDTGHRHHFHYKYNRVPTVRESARLQSFSDHFVFFGNKTQQFKQVGNAVPPLFAKIIAEEIKNYL